jgi:hypothetical protein
MIRRINKTYLLSGFLFVFLLFPLNEQALSESSERRRAFDNHKKQAAEQLETTVGVYYGWLRDIDLDRGIVLVIPILRDENRKIFYLDGQTRYNIPNTENKVENINQGDKVAIRYFAEGRTAIADVIFVVEGEFKPELYAEK